MRRFFLLPSLMGLAAFLFVSCADGSLDFTRDEIDATVHVGGDSLTIPVGHLEKVTAAEIIDKLNVQYLSVRSDGICGFSMTGTSSMKVDRIDEINFDPVDFEYVNHIDLPSLTGTAVPMSTYSLPIREEIPIRITGEGVSVEILSVNRVVLDRATADIHISFKGIEPLLDNNIRFKGKVVFPDEIRLGEPYAGKNYVPLDETLTSQGIHLSVPLTEVFLDNLKIYEKIEILRDVVVEGDLSGSLSFSDLQSLSGGLDFRFDLLIDRLVPVSAEAKVDYAVDYSDKMYLSQIPEELKQEGIHLDVVNPYLLMGLHHNLSFNVDGNVELTSMKNQQDLHTIGMELSLEGVEDQADISYLFAASKDYVLGSFDEYVKAEIGKLINPVPEIVRMDATLRTDKTRNMVFYFDRDYVMDLDYEFVLPIVLGPDFKIDLVKEVKDVSVNANIDFADAQLTLLADLENTLPVDLVFSAYAMDASDQRLNLEIAEFTIGSCESDGSAVREHVEVEMKGDLSEISRLSGLRFFIKVVSGKAAGIPLMGDDYVSGTFALRAAGGVSVDLGGIAK